MPSPLRYSLLWSSSMDAPPVRPALLTTMYLALEGWHRLGVGQRVDPSPRGLHLRFEELPGTRVVNDEVSMLEAVAGQSA